MKHKFLMLFALPFLMCSCTLDEILEKLNLKGASEEEIMQYAVENAEKWDDAFENMFFTNYTMDVYFDSHYAISDGEIVELGEHYQHHNHLEVCDTAVLYQIGVESHDYDIYMEKSGSEWLAYRYKDESKMYESITAEELHGSNDLTIEEAKKALSDELAKSDATAESLKEKTDSLTEKAMKLGEAVYKAQQEAAQQSAPEDKKDEGATDADFSEKK